MIRNYQSQGSKAYLRSQSSDAAQGPLNGFVLNRTVSVAVSNSPLPLVQSNELTEAYEYKIANTTRQLTIKKLYGVPRFRNLRFCSTSQISRGFENDKFDD